MFAICFNYMIRVQNKNKRKRKWTRPDLPRHYYHTNFCSLLVFLEERYAHIFLPAHKAFLKDFWDLPLNAQYLYVRLAGRKGRVFDRRKVTYAEIDDISAGLDMLKASGFITSPCKADFHEVVSIMTKPDLVEFLSENVKNATFKKSWKKSELVEFALTHIDQLATSVPEYFISQGRAQDLRFLSFLYFGRIEDTLQAFTLRDLGIVKTPDFKADYTARFDTQDEAQSAYFYAAALQAFKHGSDGDAANLIDTLPDWPEPVGELCAINRDKLLYELGRLSEKCKDLETALILYSASDAPLCNERAIRLRYKRHDENQNDREWVRSYLETLIDNPGDDEEYHFAADFYARKYKKKRTSLVTDVLRNAEVLKLDEAFKHEPERAAKRFYAKQDIEAYRTENALWRMLFGLLFWDELFGNAASGLHNGFERVPACLKSGQFYALFQSKIDAKLRRLEHPQALYLVLLKTFCAHHGTPNGIFRWKRKTLDKIQAFLATKNSCGAAEILRAMAENYSQTKDGFPDLMLIKDGSVSFTEVKAEGDVIRRNQLTRLQQLKRAGFKTKITRINWIIDPNQTYVVVDVETTGGRAGNHRVTEIGAVKVCGGHIIGEWQSLLNPERSIPPFITKLTGITPAMVAGAPLFRDVADSFRSFMGDAIFVAHNVNFDYGFIRSEYQQIGQSFRHPKLCTVASMRKYYKGLHSYSLKNLCAEFSIPLDTHHRALCDAQAAAQLLLRVNEKRCYQTGNLGI